MDKMQNLINQLQKQYEECAFSVGLHTTENEENAKNICKNGLEERAARALEGTLMIKGDLQEIDKNEFDYFFPYTNCTVVVGIPKIFEANRVTTNNSGNSPICEFSKLFEVARLKPDKYPEFNKNQNTCIPSMFVLGYYDKEMNFAPNKNYLTNHSEYKEYLNDLKDRFEEDKPLLEVYGILNDKDFDL